MVGRGLNCAHLGMRCCAQYFAQWEEELHVQMRTRAGAQFGQAAGQVKFRLPLEGMEAGNIRPQKPVPGLTSNMLC